MSNKKGMKRPGGMGGGHMKMGQEKAKDFKGTMKKLISYLSYIIGYSFCYRKFCI